jgi:hypothetical protein
MRTSRGQDPSIHPLGRDRPTSAARSALQKVRPVARPMSTTTSSPLGPSGHDVLSRRAPGRRALRIFSRGLRERDANLRWREVEGGEEFERCGGTLLEQRKKQLVRSEVGVA